ncbi:cytochrome P450 4C1-like [Copidosoma floridanum]|uniref:cytochrome P450 4C1-like n=1 Tax=Copidosoma floridanum TaxID=29053 RepID=UPI0006C98AA6|nr:cytochrome P450 4C1-like [Copidosoma floridanum]
MWPVFMLFIFLVVLMISLALYFWLSDYFTLRDVLGFIPGPKTWPFIGHSWQIAVIPPEDRFEWLNDLCLEYPSGMVVIWLGMQPFVNIRKPQQIEIILRSGTFIVKSKTYGILKPWVGKGLLTAKGNKWHIHRHVVRSGFEEDVLKHYLTAINKKADVLMKQISAKVRPKSSINIFSLAMKYAFDMTCETVLGIDVDTLQKSDNACSRAVKDFCEAATERYWRAWVTSDFIFYRKKLGKKMLRTVKILRDLTKNVLKQKQTERQSEKQSVEENRGERNTETKESSTLLDHILDKNETFQQPLTFEEIRQELDTFLFLGYNTISSAISWALFSLGNAPKVQAKLLKELNNVLGENGMPATIEQLTELHYLDRVIQEVLRLYPSIPIIGRSLNNHAVIDNFFIPKGTTVNIQIYQLHRDPEIWENAETFDPDRFLPENSQGRHPYAYVPFSLGPRRCIGDTLAMLEVKIVLSTILRKWRVSSLLNPSDIKMTSSFSLKPGDNRLELFFTPINKK